MLNSEGIRLQIWSCKEKRDNNEIGTIAIIFQKITSNYYSQIVSVLEENIKREVFYHCFYKFRKRKRKVLSGKFV